MTEIHIKDLVIKAYHGVFPEEKEQGQNFVIDIQAALDCNKARRNDSLDDTVSYADMIETVKRVFLEEKNDLIERAAQRIADALLDEYPKLNNVTVFLKKPDAPINAEFDYVGVKIHVKRG